MHLSRFNLLVCLALSLRAAASDATVAADGSGTHATVQAAMDAAPAGRTAPWIITIKPGRYADAKDHYREAIRLNPALGPR